MDWTGLKPKFYFDKILAKVETKCYIVTEITLIMVFPNSFQRSIASKRVKNHNKHAAFDLMRFTPGGISRVEYDKNLGRTRAVVTPNANDFIAEIPWFNFGKSIIKQCIPTEFSIQKTLMANENYPQPGGGLKKDRKHALKTFFARNIQTK